MRYRLTDRLGARGMVSTAEAFGGERLCKAAQCGRSYQVINRSVRAGALNSRDRHAVTIVVESALGQSYVENTLHRAMDIFLLLPTLLMPP